jgi:hypothetical protein
MMAFDAIDVDAKSGSSKYRSHWKPSLTYICHFTLPPLRALELALMTQKSSTAMTLNSIPRLTVQTIKTGTIGYQIPNVGRANLCSRTNNFHRRMKR